VTNAVWDAMCSEPVGQWLLDQDGPLPSSIGFGPVVCSGQGVPWAEFENGRVEGLGNTARDVNNSDCKCSRFAVVFVQLEPFTDVEVVRSKAR
jgi:hypothetical protein